MVLIRPGSPTLAESHPLWPMEDPMVDGERDRFAGDAGCHLGRPYPDYRP